MTARYSTLGDIVRIAAQPKLMTDDRFAWQDDALCRQVDMDLWFPEPGGNANAGKQICERCPVRKECLQYAIDENLRYGTFGGMSEADRRKIKSGAPVPTRSNAACEQCGTEFRPYSSRQKFCSSACQAAAGRARYKARSAAA